MRVMQSVAGVVALMKAPHLRDAEKKKKKLPQLRKCT